LSTAAEGTSSADRPRKRKVGTADVHLGLEVVRTLTRGGNGLVKVRVHKDRPGWLPRPHAGELALHSDPDTHAIVWQLKEPASSSADDNGWKPTVLMEKVSRYVEQQPEPVSRNRVESANLGKSAEYIRQAMDALIAGGYLDEQPGLRRARLLTSTKPYRTSSDFVSTSSDEVSVTSSTSSPLTGDEDADEDELARAASDEVERLAELAGKYLG
jgi:hypothetical protein